MVTASSTSGNASSSNGEDRLRGRWWRSAAGFERYRIREPAAVQLQAADRSLRVNTQIDLSIDSEAPDSELVGDLLERYFAELDARFPGGFDPERTVAAPAAELTPPHGRLLVARLHQRPVGCGAVRRLDAETAEIKRMWIDPAARGLGVGRRLLAALERAAAELGCRVVRLDTAAALTEALALYSSAGYREIDAYNENPYAAHWLEKRLP
jgi:GNAT superfamily N-acetyltransferase